MFGATSAINTAAAGAGGASGESSSIYDDDYEPKPVRGVVLGIGREGKRLNSGEKAAYAFAIIAIIITFLLSLYYVPVFFIELYFYFKERKNLR